MIRFRTEDKRKELSLDINVLKLTMMIDSRLFLDVGERVYYVDFECDLGACSTKADIDKRLFNPNLMLDVDVECKGLGNFV